MSVWAVAWAWEQKLEIGPKLTLLALAQFADERSICYPGQSTLAEMIGQSDRSVRNHLGALELAGLIKREPRYRTDEAGGRNSDVYRLSGGTRRPLPENSSGKPLTGKVALTGKNGVPYRKPVSRDPSVDPSDQCIESFDPFLKTNSTNGGRSTKRRTRGRKGTSNLTKWPDGFALDESMRAFARKQGVANPELEFEKFHAWADEFGIAYLDWKAGWRTRCLNYQRFNSNGHSAPARREVYIPTAKDRDEEFRREMSANGRAR